MQLFLPMAIACRPDDSVSPTQLLVICPLGRLAPRLQGFISPEPAIQKNKQIRWGNSSLPWGGGTGRDPFVLKKNARTSASRQFNAMDLGHKCRAVKSVSNCLMESMLDDDEATRLARGSLSFRMRRASEVAVTCRVHPKAAVCFHS